MIRRPRSCVGSEPSLRKTPAGQRARVAAFLHFTDSRSKFRIEGENPLRDRVRSLGKSSARQGAALSTEPSLNVRSASRLATRALFVWGRARSTVSSPTESRFSAFRFQIVSVLGRKFSRLWSRDWNDLTGTSLQVRSSSGGGIPCLRFCLNPPVRGRKRATAPLPGSSCSCFDGFQSTGTAAAASAPPEIFSSCGRVGRADRRDLRRAERKLIG